MWEWPKRAKNRGEPQKMTPARKRKFFWGGPNGKVVAPGILVICPIDKNRDHYTKNLAQKWHFGPNIGIFGPFDLLPDQKNNADKLPRWFFHYVGNKTFTDSNTN